MVNWNPSPPTYPLLPLWDLRLLPYTTKENAADVINLRILKQVERPGFFRWVLNAITHLLIRTRQRETHTGERQRWKWCSHRSRVNAGRWDSRGTDAPWEPLEGAQPCWHCDLSSVKRGFQNFRINVRCLKAPGLCWPVTVSTGNKHSPKQVLQVQMAASWLMSWLWPPGTLSQSCSAK